MFFSGLRLADLTLGTKLGDALGQPRRRVGAALSVNDVGG